MRYIFRHGALSTEIIRCKYMQQKAYVQCKQDI